MPDCMISAPQPEAVEAGLEVFKAGGNVMDAAIAAAMVQTVVDPQMCGIAGFGAMQIMMPETGVNGFIDFHGRAPLATTADMWTHLIERECDDGFGFVLTGRVNEFGYQSMTSPMTLCAFNHALKQYGTMSLGQGVCSPLTVRKIAAWAQGRLHSRLHVASRQACHYG